MYRLLPLFLSIFSLLCAADRHENLSFSQQNIHVLPELEILPQEHAERIIFLHIPKTAGTNVGNIARVHALHYQRLIIPRTSELSPIQITEGWIGGWKQLEINPHLLNSLPNSFFLTGHFPYGVHEYFTLPVKYVTLVRNPIERELSTANFAYQRGYIQAEQFQSYLLDQMIDNPQVRLIAGKQTMTGPCTEEVFNTAVKNIERDFLLVAPAEEVDTFLQLLACLQKWGVLAYAPMQITHEKIMDTLDPLLANALEKKHQWDMRLYARVKEQWEAYKQRVIVKQKQHSPDQKVLTLMPDFLSSREPRWLTISEIEAHNSAHAVQDLLELNQSGYPPKNPDPVRGLM